MRKDQKERGKKSQSRVGEKPSSQALVAGPER